MQTHFLRVFVANLKNDAIYRFYPESFCDKNLAIRKVFAFSDSVNRHFSIFMVVLDKAWSMCSLPCWSAQLAPIRGAQRHQDRDRGSPELSTAGLRSSGLSRWSPVAASVSLEPGASHGSSSTMLPPAISPASHEDRTRLASRSNLILRNSKMHFTNQIAAFHRVLCFCKCKKMQGFGPPDKSRLWSRTCSTSYWSQNYSRFILDT